MPNFFEQVSIPRLPQRPANPDIFCTYSIFDADSGFSRIVWKNRTHLKRNFELYEKNDLQFNKLCRLPDKEQEIALFWKEIAVSRCEPQIWEPQQRRQFACEHLAAYFETDCYYAAKKIYAKSREYSWDEYFCIARSFIYNQNKLLEVLQRYASSQGSLENYIQEVVQKTIQSEAGVSRFSRWRLLCKKGDSELKGALERGGCESGEIACFLFARKYFKQVYVLSKVKNPNRQTGQKWPDPDSEDFSSAAQCYNAEKVLPIAPHEVAAGENVSGNQIEIWMKRCIAALQNYRNSIIPTLSLDLQETGFEVKTKDEPQCFDVEWETPESLETTPEVLPKLSQKTNAAFWQELQKLKPEQHKLLLLYYGMGLTMTKMEPFFGVSQGSISRRRDTIRKKFLQALTKISGQDEWVKQYVDGWLAKKYRTPEHSDVIQAALVVAIKQLDAKERQFLQICYGQKLPLQKIAELQGIELLEVQGKLKQAKHKLQEYLILALNGWIKDYVDKWLEKVYKDLFFKSCHKSNLCWQSEVNPENIEVILQETLKLIHESK